MTAPSVWRSRPVFITSTFRDMHAERDYLRERVFPELEERLRARRCHLEPVDLRWGVQTLDATQEQAKELLVLKVCLAEVERSRPFLVALLGDRYGWVPPAERMAAAAQEAGLDGRVAGRSVTELEIDFGVLTSPVQRQRCLFYFRDPLPFERMHPMVAAEYSDAYAGDHAAAARLIALKERIERELPDRVRHYVAAWDQDKQQVTSLEAWGAIVLEDLWRELDAETSDQMHQTEPTWQDAERWALEQFVEDRTRAFIGRDALVAELLGLVTSPPADDGPWGMCVTGLAGTGKSALFARLWRQLAAENVFVLAHAAGISPRANEVDAMLRRWIDELTPVVGVGEPLDDGGSGDDVEAKFHELLGRASTQRRVVVLVDALDQFEPTARAQHLTWLPSLWPPNARLITTTIPGTEAEALARRRGVQVRELPPLHAIEAATIVRAICDRYHRVLHPAVLDAILARRRNDGILAATNPLWLELAVEELNLLDADDFARAEREFMGPLDARLHQLLLDVVATMPPDVLDMYGWMLERAEHVHGQPWARAFVNAITVSRLGWREMDLRGLMPVLSGEPWDDDLKFAALRRTFRAHVVQRGTLGQWDFAHAQLRLAVLQRNLTADGMLRAVHRIIADYLEQRPQEDPLREIELMFHLIGADQRQRAARYYISDLVEAHRQHSLVVKSRGDAATLAMAEHIHRGGQADSNANLRWVVSLLDEELDGNEQHFLLVAKFVTHLSEALSSRTQLALRRAILEAATQRLEQFLELGADNHHWSWQLAEAYAGLAEVSAAEGAVAAALKHRHAAHKILVTLRGRLPLLAESHRRLAKSYFCIGDLELAGKDLKAARDAFEAGLSAFARLSDADPGNPVWLRDTYTAYHELGRVLEQAGDLRGARSAFESHRSGIATLAQQTPGRGRWQRDLALAERSLGMVLAANGEQPRALQHLAEANRVWRQLVHADPTSDLLARELIQSHGVLGELQRRMGDQSAALRNHQEALALAGRMAQRDIDNMTWQVSLYECHRRLGKLYASLGDDERALATHQASLMICLRMCNADQTNLQARHDATVLRTHIGEILAKQGRLEAALSVYRQALEIIEPIAAARLGDVASRRSVFILETRVGEVELAQGRLIEAHDAFSLAFARAEHLARQFPDNLEQQRDLAMAHVGLGDIEGKSGNLADAEHQFDAARAMLERLISASGDFELQQDFADCHARRAKALAAAGDPLAVAAFRDAAQALRILAQGKPPHGDGVGQLVLILSRTAELLLARGDIDAARATFDEARITLAQVVASFPHQRDGFAELLRVGSALASALSGQDDHAARIDIHRGVVTVLEARHAAAPTARGARADLAVAQVELALAYGAVGDQDAAQDSWRRALELMRYMRHDGTLDSHRGLADMLRKLEASIVDVDPDSGRR